MNGALLLKVLRGISPFSSSSGTFWRTTYTCVEREREGTAREEREQKGEKQTDSASLRKKEKTGAAVATRVSNSECRIRPVPLADRAVLRRDHAQDEKSSPLTVRGRAEKCEKCSRARGLERVDGKPKASTKASSFLLLGRESSDCLRPPRAPLAGLERLR